eukprot:1157398-Pyramimonas_sp.AAC.1
MGTYFGLYIYMLQETRLMKKPAANVLRVVDLGVSKKALQRMRQKLEEHFGERWPTITTTEVVMQYVKPMTEGKFCRLAELPGFFLVGE